MSPRWFTVPGRGSGPLSAAGRKALEDGPLRARVQYEAARERLRAVTARPAGQAPRRPSAGAS